MKKKLPIIYSANIKLRNSGAGSVHVIEVAKQLNLQGRLLRLLVPTYEGAFSCETLSGGKMRVLQLFRNSNLSLVFFDVIIIPYLIYYRVIYGRYNLLCRPHVFTLFQNMIANFIGCKVIYEVNGVEELEYKAKGLPSWLCAYFKLSIRWNATFVHKFQCVTKGIAEYLRKVYKIPSTKLLVIENGVDLDLFFPMDKSRSREKFRLPQERFIAGFIGSFAPWQGLVNTVKAIAQIDVSLPVTGVFVGGGMLRGELLKIALHAPDNRFIFIDWIPHKNVPDIISAFDLALLIREYNFNLPMGSPIKLFEYLACGVPILASPVDGIINIPGAEAIHFINPCRIDNIKKFLTELVQKHISGIEWRKRSLQRQIEIAKAHSWQLVITRLLNEIDSL